MKIGELVKNYIPPIFAYCEEIDHTEIERLLDANISKNEFNINYPFCIDIKKINETERKSQSKRYWTEEYTVLGKTVRVTSQWIKSNYPYFINYLHNMKIIDEMKYQNIMSQSDVDTNEKPAVRKNQRYRGYHIGNAQNAMIRNILSNRDGGEFDKKQWEETKIHFSNKCVYCGGNDNLQMDHAIPINREKLGEHRMGNVVLCCKSCNGRKQQKDYQTYCEQIEKHEVIDIIENFMKTHGYKPLGNDEEIKKLLNDAYTEAGTIAEKYIKLLNQLLSDKEYDS